MKGETFIMKQNPAEKTDFCCAELASACLEDGGQYVYFREAGPPVLLYVGEAEPEGSLIPA